VTLETVTVCVIVATDLVVATYDVFALVRGGYKATISYVLLKAARNYPLIPFAFGVLIGHLFWFQGTPPS
jgi:hypothetical protein